LRPFPCHPGDAIGGLASLRAASPSVILHPAKDDTPFPPFSPVPSADLPCIPCVPWFPRRSSWAVRRIHQGPRSPDQTVLAHETHEWTQVDRSHPIHF